MELPQSRVVFDRERILHAIDGLADRVNARCAPQEWTLMCIMNGALMFTAELMRRLTFPLRLDAVRVTRYHDTTSGSELRWHSRPGSTIEGSRILLVDDIFDEGETLKQLSDYLRSEGAAEIVSVVLVEKQHARKVDGYRPDLVGLACPDTYVFGFGMDYRGRFRQLDDIRELVEES